MSGSLQAGFSPHKRFRLSSVTLCGKPIPGGKLYLTLKNIDVSGSVRSQGQVPGLMVHVENQGEAVEILDLRDFASSRPNNIVGGRCSVSASPSQKRLVLTYPKASRDYDMELLLRNEWDVHEIVSCLTRLGIKCPSPQPTGMYYPPMIVLAPPTRLSKTPGPRGSHDFMGYLQRALTPRPSSVPHERVQHGTHARPIQQPGPERSRSGHALSGLAAIQEALSETGRRPNERHAKQKRDSRDVGNPGGQDQHQNAAKKIRSGEQEFHASKPNVAVLDVAVMYEKLLAECASLWDEASRRCRVARTSEDPEGEWDAEKLLSEWISQGIILDRKLRQLCASELEKIVREDA